MHFWIGNHRGPHNLRYPRNYQPSNYATGLTSPPRQSSNSLTLQDSSVHLGPTSNAETPNHQEPANNGSWGVLKWATWATVAFICVFFVVTEFYKYHQGSNHGVLAWVLGGFGVAFILVVFGCIVSMCQGHAKVRRERQQPSQMPTAVELL